MKEEKQKKTPNIRKESNDIFLLCPPYILKNNNKKKINMHEEKNLHSSFFIY